MFRRFKANADNGDEEEEDGDNNGVVEKRDRENNKRKKRGRLLLVGCSYKRGLQRAKKTIFSPFNKFQKLCRRYTRSSSSSSSSSTSWCCLCMSKPQTLDTDFEGIDPNDPNVSYEYIKSLIEKNDFFSKECNTHFSD